MHWYKRLRKLFHRKQLDADIEHEFDFHLAQSVDNLMSAGMSEEEAHHTARRRFGNYTLHKESTRNMALSVLVENVWRDIWYGIRQLRRNPGLTIVVALALGIGLGANITIFGFVSALLLRQLDVREPDQLVRVLGQGGNTQLAGATNSEAHIRVQDFLQYRDRNQSFSDLAAQSIGGPAQVRIEGPPQVIPVMPVSGNYFITVGVPAAIGRTITPEDAASGALGVIVLSDAGWRRFFGADPAVIGKTVFINSIPKTIVGITPDWFKGTTSPLVPQIYRPLEESSSGRVDLIGRLRPDVTTDQARADLLRIGTQLTAQDQVRRTVEIYPAKVMAPFLVRSFTLFAAMFTIIVAVVLMIVCDNIAILLLARSAARHKEISIRLSLGATRFRLIPQLLVESLLLCVAGGLLGTYLAYVTAQFLRQIYLPVPMPFALTFNLDWRVVVFAAAISLGATLLSGLAPALQSLKTDVVSALKGEGGTSRGSHVRSGLIISQMTLSTMLLVTAAALSHSLILPPSDNRGLVSKGILMSTINLGGPEYTPPKRAAFLETLLRRMEQTPGVVAATIVDNVPLTNNNPITPTEFRSAAITQSVYVNHVSRGFFQTLNIPLLAGRDFATSDSTSTRAVGIVNESLARRFWPGENPIGKLLQNADGFGVAVIGVARNSKYESMDEPEKSFLYRPMTQESVGLPTFLIKATGDPSTIFSFLRARVAEIDPKLAPYNLITLDERIGLSLLMNRAAATVTGSMGLLALALGSIGIYGTMSFLVEQRRREIGIRMALGASSDGVVKLITKQGMVWTAKGLMLGLVGGFGATWLLAHFLYGVSAADPFAFIVTPVILGGSAYLACYFPARSASRLDALALLRNE